MVTRRVPRRQAGVGSPKISQKRWALRGDIIAYPYCTIAMVSVSVAIVLIGQSSSCGPVRGPWVGSGGDEGRHVALVHETPLIAVARIVPAKQGQLVRSRPVHAEQRVLGVIGIGRVRE